MSERMSALMDGELPEEQAMGELGRLRSDAGERDAWDTYHLIGDAIRGDLYPSSHRAIAARLAKEPTVLAPQSRRPARQQVLRYAMSAAAGVAGIVFVIWTAGPAMNSGAPQSASVSPAAGQGLAPAMAQMDRSGSPGNKAPASAGGVESYLFVHQQTLSGLPSVTPVAWTAERTAGSAR
jgi:sigma-E factor negative regulatory protein RseA